MKWFVLENTWLSRGFSSFGWGNGYVVIPKEHPLHGVDYDNISVEVHGGLTFGEKVDEEMIESWCAGENLTTKDIGAWCIGFDTAHAGDSLKRWPKTAVEEETKRLAEQIENYKEHS